MITFSMTGSLIPANVTGTGGWLAQRPWANLALSFLPLDNLILLLPIIYIDMALKQPFARNSTF